MTARKMNLLRGVYPFNIPIMDKFPDMINYMQEKLSKEGILKTGDRVVILSGTPGGEANTVDFVQIYHFK